MRTYFLLASFMSSNCNKDWQLKANDHIFVTLVRGANESHDEAEGASSIPAVDISGFFSRYIEMRLRD